MNFLSPARNISVVLDSVIFINALRKPESMEGRILEYAVAERYILVISESVLQEVRRILKDDFGITDSMIDVLMSPVLDVGILVREYEGSLTITMNDPNDEPILRTAIGGSDNIIVTRDKGLLAVGQYDNIVIRHIFDFRYYFPEEVARKE